MGGRRPSPPFNEADAVNSPVLDVFVPDQGDRAMMASVLTEAASQHGLDRHVQSDAARRGFWISNDLADVVYDDTDEEDDSTEDDSPKTPDEAPAKTGRTKK